MPPAVVPAVELRLLAASSPSVCGAGTPMLWPFGASWGEAWRRWPECLRGALATKVGCQLAVSTCKLIPLLPRFCFSFSKRCQSRFARYRPSSCSAQPLLTLITSLRDWLRRQTLWTPALLQRGATCTLRGRTDAQAPQLRAPPGLQSSFGGRMGRRRATAAEQEKPRAIPQEPDPCCSPAAVLLVARRLCSRSGSLRPSPECERPRGLQRETAPVRNEGVAPSPPGSSVAAPASGPPPVLGSWPNFPLGTGALR